MKKVTYEDIFNTHLSLKKDKLREKYLIVPEESYQTLLNDKDTWTEDDKLFAFVHGQKYQIIPAETVPDGRY